MNQITEIQFNSLVSKIYDLLMSNEDMGMGEMGNCNEAADILAREWMEENNIELI